MEINDIFETKAFESKAFESKAFESKAGFPPDAVVTHSEMMRTFDAFKAANDERIDAVERKAADVLHDDKVARIDATLDAQTRRLDELTLKSARPQLGLERAVAPAISREHKAAFEGYVRSGESAGLRALEAKAMSVGTPSPTAAISCPKRSSARSASALPRSRRSARIASVREISGNVYKKPFMTAGPATGWVGETAARPQTNSPTLDELCVPGDGALRHAGGDRDAAGGLRRQHRRMDRERSRAGLRGAGGRGLRQRRRHQQAEGLSAIRQGGEASWAWGKIGYIATGATRAFPERGPVRSR